jgi:hypothetical protein
MDPDVKRRAPGDALVVPEVTPRSVPLVGAVAALLISCVGVAERPPSSGPVPSPTPIVSPTPGARPSGPDEIVVRVELVGGMLPPLEAERELPRISIYGHGSVLEPAPRDDVFPGPAGYELLSYRIDGELLDAILERAASVGLRGLDRRFEQTGSEFVTDAGYTVVTVADGDGPPHVTRVDALFDAADESAERRRIADFVSALRELRQSAEDETTFEPTAVAVHVAVADPGSIPDPALIEEMPWPFDDPLATWGEPIPPTTVAVRCRVVDGEELEEALPALAAAHSATVFLDDAGDRRFVAYRPLLPDEFGC